MQEQFHGWVEENHPDLAARYFEPGSIWFLVFDADTGHFQVGLLDEFLASRS